MQRPLVVQSMTFDEWLKTTNITEQDTLLYNWGKTVWEAAFNEGYVTGLFDQDQNDE